jgi:ABC-type transport system involved in multi-copper enzyme maturation permease subunit
MSVPTTPSSPAGTAAPAATAPAAVLPPAARPQAGPSFATAALRIFDLSLGRMLWSRGTVFMALLVGLPVILSLLVRGAQALGLPAMRIDGQAVGGPTIFGFMVWWIYLRFIVPVLAVYYGTALIADEVEDKTITYLFTRPIPRGAVMAGKYLAYLVCTVMVVLPSLMIVYFLIGTQGSSIAATFPSLVKDLALMALGLFAYGALFAWVGARFKRPLVIGLVYIFGWEQMALVIPGYLRRTAIAFYIQSMVPHAMPSDGLLGLIQNLLPERVSLAVAALSLVVIGVGFLWLAVRVVERREYVLEQ